MQDWGLKTGRASSTPRRVAGSDRYFQVLYSTTYLSANSVHISFRARPTSVWILTCFHNYVAYVYLWHYIIWIANEAHKHWTNGSQATECTLLWTCSNGNADQVMMDQRQTMRSGLKLFGYELRSVKIPNFCPSFLSHPYTWTTYWAYNTINTQCILNIN